MSVLVCVSVWMSVLVCVCVGMSVYECVCVCMSVFVCVWVCAPVSESLFLAYLLSTAVFPTIKIIFQQESMITYAEVIFKRKFENTHLHNRVLEGVTNLWSILQLGTPPFTMLTGEGRGIICYLVTPVLTPYCGQCTHSGSVVWWVTLNIRNNLYGATITHVLLTFKAV